MTSAIKAKRTNYRKRDYEAFIYLAPWLLGFLTLQLYPFISSFIYSFTDYGLGDTVSFVGLKNYITLFTTDQDFLISLRVTLLYTIITVPGKIILALAIAVLMNRKMRGINFLRTLYYIPSLFGGSVAVSLLWKIMFMDTGIVNSLFNSLGLPSIHWLGDPNVALLTICSLEIWQFGSSMILFLAALKQVPAALYEAASIDGANAARRFFSITLPQITPVLFFNLIMQTINALQNFTSAMVVTSGGPLKATYVLGMKLYTEGFSFFKMGYASAISWIIFILIMAVTGLLFRSSSTWVYYEDAGDF
jgi:oligogalacturonide transport system permease protein